MPKFGCSCGNILNISGVWPDCEARIVPMSRIGKIADKLDSGENINGDNLYELVDEVSVTTYKCDVCGRMHLEEKDGSFSSYFKEKNVQ